MKVASIPRLHIFFFFFNDTATTEIYTLSLHDALPISGMLRSGSMALPGELEHAPDVLAVPASKVDRLGVDLRRDRKSTRLNSSHSQISYAVFCLKKKKKTYWSSHRPSHSCGR